MSESGSNIIEDIFQENHTSPTLEMIPFSRMRVSEPEEKEEQGLALSPQNSTDKAIF